MSNDKTNPNDPQNPDDLTRPLSAPDATPAPKAATPPGGSATSDALDDPYSADSTSTTASEAYADEEVEPRGSRWRRLRAAGRGRKFGLPAVIGAAVGGLLLGGLGVAGVAAVADHHGHGGRGDRGEMGGHQFPGGFDHDGHGRIGGHGERGGMGGHMPDQMPGQPGEAPDFDQDGQPDTTTPDTTTPDNTTPTPSQSPSASNKNSSVNS